MYGRVPTGESVVAVSRPPVVASRNLAIPKSSTFTMPSSVTITFAGLMSRCTMPARCAVARARQTCAASTATRSGGSGPSATDSRRVRPESNGMTR